MRTKAIDRLWLGGREAGHAAAQLSFPDSRAERLSGRRPIDRHRPPACHPGNGGALPLSPVLRAAAGACPRGAQRRVLRPAHGAGLAGPRRDPGDRESTRQAGSRRDRRRLRVPSLYRRGARAWLPDGRERQCRRTAWRLGRVSGRADSTFGDRAASEGIPSGDDRAATERPAREPPAGASEEIPSGGAPETNSNRKVS